MGVFLCFITRILGGGKAVVSGALMFMLVRKHHRLQSEAAWGFRPSNGTAWLTETLCLERRELPYYQLKSSIFSVIVASTDDA
jgi:hypothetical protein